MLALEAVRAGREWVSEKVAGLEGNRRARCLRLIPAELASIVVCTASMLQLFFTYKTAAVGVHLVRAPMGDGLHSPCSVWTRLPHFNSLWRCRRAVLDALSPLGDDCIFGGDGAIYLWAKLPEGTPLLAVPTVYTAYRACQASVVRARALSFFFNRRMRRRRGCGVLVSPAA